jgi:hypothetical protein
LDAPGAVRNVRHESNVSVARVILSEVWKLIDLCPSASEREPLLPLGVLLTSSGAPPGCFSWTLSWLVFLMALDGFRVDGTKRSRKAP